MFFSNTFLIKSWLLTSLPVFWSFVNPLVIFLLTRWNWNWYFKCDHIIEGKAIQAGLVDYLCCSLFCWFLFVCLLLHLSDAASRFHPELLSSRLVPPLEQLLVTSPQQDPVTPGEECCHFLFAGCICIIAFLWHLDVRIHVNSGNSW